MEPLLPLFPLDLVLFPGAPLPLHIFEPRYKEMIGECVREKRPFGVVRAVESTQQGHGIARCGCTAEIRDVLRRYEDGRLDILTLGRQRFEVIDLDQERAFLRGTVSYFEDDEAAVPGEDVRRSVLELHSEVLSLTGTEASKIESEAEPLSFRLASVLPVDLDFKQTFLEMRSEDERISTLLDYYTRVIPKLKHLAFGRQKARGNGLVH
jgi:Lon protease-like protein